MDGKTIHNVDCLTSKIIYSVLLSQKAEHHYLQLSCENTLNITPGKRGWAEIYKRKIKNIVYKKLSEFNFKILHKIVFTGCIINKWNKNISANCLYCDERENPYHILYGCSRITNFWEYYSKISQSNITWKSIIIGYPDNCAGNTAKTFLTTFHTLYSKHG